MALATSAPEERRTTRYLIRFPVRLGIGDHVLELQTQNISLDGIFVRCGALPHVGAEVACEMRLPFGLGTTVLSGRVIHLVMPSNTVGRVPGLGIGWAEGQEPAKERWRDFLHQVIALYHGLSDEQRLKLINEVGVEARYNTRTDATLKIRFKDVDQLTSVYTHDISAGGLFMITDRDFIIGTQIQIEAVHPRTGESFPMKGAIRWMGIKEGQRGAGVELVLLDDDARSDFWKFVNHGGLSDILA